ncbi:uncharacterized protein LOC142333192 isoform X3 [Lycorma delicatula]|uniref:uncharacterized protein LOC142333192 isoform X3 n=1 Tax=Lycorma delicatula TaxID=130591 RepID=UPI003F514FF7
MLGRTPVEDSTKAGMVLLKTSKRIIKLPHGSLNTADSATEVTGLPPVEVYESIRNGEGNGVTDFSYYDGSICNCKPLYGLKTFHYALQYFNGLYDSEGLLNKVSSLHHCERLQYRKLCV